jgi:hypothetical protein
MMEAYWAGQDIEQARDAYFERQRQKLVRE